MTHRHPLARPVRIFSAGPEALMAVSDLRQDGPAVRGTMLLDAAAVGADGRTALGALGVLVDDVLGYAVIGSLPVGEWSVSTEIGIELLRPLPPAGERLHAAARAVGGMMSVGEVLDDRGDLLAISRERGLPSRLRPQSQELNGVALSRPRDFVTALELGRADDGDDAWTMPCGRSFLNPNRVMHGGVSFGACEAVATSSRSAAGSGLPTSSVHIRHTRPVPSGTVLSITAATRHAGRSFWVTEVVATALGRVCATATVCAQELGSS